MISLITIIRLDLNEISIWNNDIASLLAYFLQQRDKHDDICSSFRSATAHLDSLGEVDVIADAEVFSNNNMFDFHFHSLAN